MKSKIILEKLENSFPCNTCLVLAICKIRCEHLTKSKILYLTYTCSIFRQWYNEFNLDLVNNIENIVNQTFPLKKVN